MNTETCAHHWKIAPPNGETSEGECIFCHAKQQFRNSIQFDNVPRVFPKYDFSQDYLYLPYIRED